MVDTIKFIGTLLVVVILVVFAYSLIIPQVNNPPEIYIQENETYSLFENTLQLISVVPEVTYQAHAVERHGLDAINIRNSLCEKGPSQVFKLKTPYDIRFFLLCQLDDGRYGFQIITKDAIKKTYVEVSAFVRGDGTMKEFINYMIKIGATKFTGEIK